MEKKILFILLLIAIRGLTGKESFAQKPGLEKIDSLVAVLSKAKEDTTKVNMLNSLADKLLNIHPDSAIYFANVAKELSTKLNFKTGLANAYLNFGIAKKNLAEYTEALKDNFTALKLFEEIDSKRGIAKSYQTIGNIYYHLGNYPEALVNHFASLKIFKETNNKQGIAATCSNIGNVYNIKKNYSEALKYQLESLKIREQIGDKNGTASSYNNIGVIYFEQSNYPEALKNFFAASEINEPTGNIMLQTNILDNIGNIYEAQGKYQDALNKHFASLKMREQIGDKLGIANIFLSTASIYTKQKKIREASQYLNKSIALAKKIGSLKIIEYGFQALTGLDSLQGDFKQAFEHHKLYFAYRDSLVNEENTKKMVQSQMQFDFDKKEAETKAAQDKKDVLAYSEIKRQTLIRNSTFAGISIIGIFSFFLVRSVNRRRKTSFEKQVSEVEMTALRSQMNPHFIFNSLNSINNYVMSNDKKNASDYLGKFSKLMRLILENSREQDVPLEKDLSALELYMELEAMRFDNKFSYIIEVADDIDQENTLVPPMILQPFVENSIIHALQHKENEGKILIRVQKENEMIFCAVEDNGVGRHKATGMKEKASTHNGESLGMKIANARIDIINKIKKAKASVNQIDLSEGMRVEVKLPFELAF